MSRARVAVPAVIPAALAVWLALEALPYRRRALDTVPVAARPALAAIALFAVCGYGLTRLLLPAALRDRELLWVLPVGACATGLGLTVLGFMAVPFKVSLTIVIAVGLGLAAYAVRRRAAAAVRGAELAWPAYLAVLLIAIALVPMFGLGYATVTGNGSDAHLAAGTAQFLQHSYPTSVNVKEPVDQMPLLWRSKYPIYYALGGVATLSGLETWQALTAAAGVMLALAAVGFYLVARDLLAASVFGAVCAMGLAGLDRMVLHTGLNPYFNQTWGYFTLPFSLVLAWWAVAGRPPGAAPAETPVKRAGAAVLLAMFLAVGAFAYPLALPIPLVAVLVFWLLERRARRSRGERVARVRSVYRGRRSLLWIVPAAALAVPLLGVAEKSVSAAAVVLDPTRSLHYWAGDLPGWVPTYQFFALGSPTLAWPAVVAIVLLAALALRRRPAALAWGLGAVIAFGLVAAVYFRQRDFGWYFHFKVLAFVAPLVVVCAAVAVSRLRAVGLALLAAFVLSAQAGARQEIDHTGRQLGQPTIDLRGWDRALPHGASIRLDMWPPRQLWAAYFLSGHRLCSELPLLRTDYPHVPASRKADYVVVERVGSKPADAIGPPLRANPGYVLYRLNPALPGPEHCSQRMQTRVVSATGL